MNMLAAQLEAKLAPGMIVPSSIRGLYDWIEARGTFVDMAKGRIGLLFPEAEKKAGWTDTHRPGGTDISFAAEGSDNMRYWFGKDDPAVNGRLCVFAQTGAEGSMAAFWLDHAGEQRIVHLGSGSGSTLVCTLGATPIDLLRLLAIGYDEICWGDFSATPAELGPPVVAPNHAYRDWLTRSFDVTVPATGGAIVAKPAFMESENSADPFWRWVRSHTQ